MNHEQLLLINSHQQILNCYERDILIKSYPISTAKNGLGEQMGSECTPRGWHRTHQIIGLAQPENAVFVGRVWTEEIYSDKLAIENPQRDWILTRIIQLDGLEPGRNNGGDVDSLQRYIYIHGTPDDTLLGVAGSRGCIRIRNQAIIEMADWLKIDAKIYIE